MKILMMIAVLAMMSGCATTKQFKALEYKVKRMSWDVNGLESNLSKQYPMYMVTNRLDKIEAKLK